MSYTFYEGEDILEELEKLNDSLYEAEEHSSDIESMIRSENYLSEDDRGSIESSMDENIKKLFEILNNMIRAIESYSFDYYGYYLKTQLIEKTSESKIKLEKIKELLKLTDEKLSNAINEINKIRD